MNTSRFHQTPEFIFNNINMLYNLQDKQISFLLLEIIGITSTNMTSLLPLRPISISLVHTFITSNVVQKSYVSWKGKYTYSR